MRYVLSTSAILALLLVSGCARDISSDVYSESSVGEVNSTYVGLVMSARQVVVKGSEKLSNNGLGGFMGGVTGGVLGNTIGNGRGRIVTTTAGALAGMAAGALIEDKLSRNTAIEYVVKLEETGRLYTIVQGRDTLYRAGQRVYLSVSNSGRSRIISLAQ